MLRNEIRRSCSLLLYASLTHIAFAVIFARARSRKRDTVVLQHSMEEISLLHTCIPAISKAFLASKAFSPLHLDVN